MQDQPKGSWGREHELPLAEATHSSVGPGKELIVISVSEDGDSLSESHSSLSSSRHREFAMLLIMSMPEVQARRSFRQPPISELLNIPSAQTHCPTTIASLSKSEALFWLPSLCSFLYQLPS